MKAVFFIPKENQGQAKSRVYGDELVSRQSITLRDSQALGIDKEGYYLQVEGDESAVKKAEEILKDVAEKLDGKQAEEVNSAIENQDSSAAAGFGSLFG